MDNSCGRDGNFLSLLSSDAADNELLPPVSKLGLSCFANEAGATIDEGFAKVVCSGVNCISRESGQPSTQQRYGYVSSSGGEGKT